MRARPPRRPAASRSPTRSSAGWPRREPDRASPRRSRSLGEHKSLPLHCDPLRRLVGFLAVATALAPALPAGAALTPIKRTVGETTLPRVRAGVLHVPANQGSDRVRVIVGLRLPPLAAAYGRRFAAAEARQKLDVSTSASRRYLARVVAAQRRAVAELHRAIPEARVGPRFQIVLDGLAVSLPATKLAKLAGLGLATRIYPSMRYRLLTDTSPSVIAADALHARTGARGEGVKIGIVDDGVDPTNPFFNPAGFTYPPGFPKGGRRWTTPKVIVARAFPGPHSGRPGRLALDRHASFHGTHVAGIAAGDAGTSSPGGNDHPPTTGLSGVAAPDQLSRIPIEVIQANEFPAAVASSPVPLIDVGTLTSPGGAPVDRRICGSLDDPNNPDLTPLRAGALTGMIALASRGHCTFVSKAERARRAGAVGLILVDNRRGEANNIPVPLTIPGGMISDLDGARLRAYLATTNGTAPVTVGRLPDRIETGRSGIITSFSSAGLTAFQDLLKPDVAAPGGQILSSTLPEFTGGSPFAVFDGTSMATPHVAGAAALLVQLHPTWSPQQIKSALVSTAGAGWVDTARTREAPVTLEGGGLINVPRANDPQVFTDPASLSFRELDVTNGGVSKALLVRVSDAGDGAGTWSAELAPQSATSGASLSVPSFVDVPPGGEGALVAIARASAGAAPGEDYGFIVLRRGEVTRRIPYAFVVSKPALATVTPEKLTPFVTGDTRDGANRVSVYCCPSEPFGPPPDYVGPPMKETGSEHLYVTNVNKPLVNLGVAAWATSDGAIVHPWFLGSKDEGDVQGYDGTPVNQNELMFDYSIDIGAAGAAFPRQGQYYVSVDSGSDPFTQQAEPGRYVVRSWQNDLKPPAVKILTRRVGAGRPTIVARVLDAKSGVDPLSLVIGYRRVLVGAALYDPFSGLAIFPLPAAAPRVPAGKTRLQLEASDFQEAKNLETIGNNLMPNTTFKSIRLRGVQGPAVTWVSPRSGACATKNTALAVVASSNKKVRSVRFGVDGRRIAVDRNGALDLFTATWHTAGAKRGHRVLTATATDAAGKRITARRSVRVCK